MIFIILQTDREKFVIGKSLQAYTEFPIILFVGGKPRFESNVRK